MEDTANSSLTSFNTEKDIKNIYLPDINNSRGSERGESPIIQELLRRGDLRGKSRTTPLSREYMDRADDRPQFIHRGLNLEFATLNSTEREVNETKPTRLKRPGPVPNGEVDRSKYLMEEEEEE